MLLLMCMFQPIEQRAHGGSKVNINGRACLNFLACPSLSRVQMKEALKRGEVLDLNQPTRWLFII